MSISFEEAKKTEEDARLVMEWRNNTLTLEMSFHRDPKIWEKFWTEYLNNYFGDDHPKPVFVRLGSERIGFLRFKKYQTEKLQGNQVEININMAPNFRGKGLGSKVLREVSQYLLEKNFDFIVAEIKLKNLASVRAFRNANYVFLDKIDKQIEDTGEVVPINRFYVNRQFMSSVAVSNALVISAHPDDEVLGAGGTMVKLAREGTDVFVVYVGTGISARYEDPEKFNLEIDEQKKEIRQDAMNATKLLHVRKTFFLDFADNRLDSISAMEITHKLRRIVTEIKPKVVFTHHHGDYNWDHKKVYEASLMACRPNFGDFYPETILSYEVLSSTERAFQTPQFVFCPNYYVDIKDSVELKKQAMDLYKSEVKQYPHPRSPKGIDILAQKRGNEVSLEFAEAFQLIRKIRL